MDVVFVCVNMLLKKTSIVFSVNTVLNGLLCN